MLSFTNTTTALILRYYSSTDSMDTSTFKTFKAKLYDMTPLGEVLVGKVHVTIDFGDVNERSLSSKFVLKDIIEVDELPTFNIMDFPDTAVLPAIDLQVASSVYQTASSSVPLDVIDSVNNEDDTVDMPDFEHFNDDECLLDVFNLSNDELEAFYEEDTIQWVPMNCLAGKLGIEVNKVGEVRSTNPEIHLIQGCDDRMKMSKYNKGLGGKCYTVYVYRAGKQKLYDFHLGMEVFKTEIRMTAPC